MIKNTLAYRVVTVLLVFSGFASAQSSGIEQDIDLLVGISKQSQEHFQNGVAALNAGRRSEAKSAFDQSIKVFFAAKIDVRKVPRLSDCVEILIETIYRIEFPEPGQRPDSSSLSAACGWRGSAIAGLYARSEESLEKGFSSQSFEPSPLDELSKLQLTADETESANTPEARLEYAQIERSVAANSLGLSFQMHPMVQQFLNYYQGRGKGTMRTGLYRSGMFMHMARRIFREEGIPENVAWLGQVESMWKPVALSSASASGLWQFIPSTGERFGLRRTAYVDERNSFEKATRASARYLKFLVNRYRGNWELALAAYNSGEGNVDRAIRRAGVSNFWAAYPYLPQETRNYVPNILATILIANFPQRYGFAGLMPAPRLDYAHVTAGPLTDLATIARASGTTVQYLRYLNPELRSNVTPPENYLIRIPVVRPIKNPSASLGAG